MKIYFEILCFLLTDIIREEQIGCPRMEISAVRYTDHPLNAGVNAVYILNAQTADIHAFSAADSRERPLCAFILPGDTSFPGALMNFFVPTDNLAFISPGADTEHALYRIENSMAALAGWEAELNEKLLYESDMPTFLSLGKPFLPRQYFLFDRDLNTVYNSDEALLSNEAFSTMLSQGLFIDLISDKKFHDAVNENDIFYYENTEGGWSVCRNITSDGEYVARLIMLLESGETKLHPGGEMIFRIFSDYVNKAFNLGRYSLEHHSSDRPHRILKEIAGGKAFSGQTADMNFRFYLKEHRAFAVMVFRFYSDELWPVHLETTLPYMAVLLEKNIRGTIAAASADEIIMLAGCTDADIRGGDLLRQTASFVRDNLCKAGISTVFEDLSCLYQAVCCARAALLIGNEARPHLWYYLFDDFRLDYIIRKSTRDISAELLCHPAIRKLKKYDTENDAELNRTLYVYLKNSKNMTKAADEIFIHRTSFFHRINRIKELTALDLDDPGTVLELMMSYELIKTR